MSIIVLKMRFASLSPKVPVSLPGKNLLRSSLLTVILRDPVSKPLGFISGNA